MSTSEISTGKAIGRILIALLIALAVFFLSNITAGTAVFVTGNQELAQPIVHISMLIFSFVLILMIDLFLGIVLDTVYYSLWPRGAKLFF